MDLSEHEKRVIIEYRKGGASLKAAINKLLDLEEPRPQLRIVKDSKQ